MDLLQSYYDINNNVWRLKEDYTQLKPTLKQLQNYRIKLNAWKQFQLIQKEE